MVLMLFPPKFNRPLALTSERCENPCPSVLQVRKVVRSEVSWSPDYLVLAVGNDDGYVIGLDK